MPALLVLTGKYELDFPIHEKGGIDTNALYSPNGERILTEADLANLSEDVTFDNSIITYNSEDLVSQVVTNYLDGSQRVLNMNYNSEQLITFMTMTYKTLVRTYTFNRDAQDRVISITT